jgi:intracellular septation protein A
MAEKGALKSEKINPWLRRLSRISAWALLASVLVLVGSGWGITQTGIIYRLSFGLIDRRLADAVHRDMNLPLAVFFLTHVLVNVKIAVSKNHPSRPWLTDLVLGLVGAGSLWVVIYMEFFRSGG